MSWAEVDVLRKEIDSVDNNVQLLANKTYGVIPPLTNNTAMNVTTTYTTASSVATTAGDVITLPTLSGAKNIYALKFFATSGSYAGQYDKVMLNIDGTTIELSANPSPRIATNSSEQFLCWVGQNTNRVSFDWSSTASKPIANFPVQVSCKSSITISLQASTIQSNDTGKVRCQVLYSK